MRQDRLKWNEIYRNRDCSFDPTPIVKNYCHLATRGVALDIAAGNGRNALFLAENGFSNELLHAFLSLRVIYYQEAEASSEGESPWMASLVAVKGH
jgi:hypothetical protein